MKSRHARSIFIAIAITVVSLVGTGKTHAGSPATLVVQVFPFPATAGSDLTFTLTVTNNGTGGTVNALVSNTLPPSVDLVSISNSVGTITQVLDVVIWTAPNILVGTAVQAQIVVTPTVDGTITNVTTFSINGGPTSNPLVFPIDVDPAGPDLTASVIAGGTTCSNTSKATVCTITGTLDLANNGESYLHTDFTLSQSCKLPPKVGCKIAAALSSTTYDETTLLTLPTHAIAFFLSDDATLDGGDPLAGAVDSSVLLKALIKNKAPKLKFKVPKGISTTGKFLIVKVDGANTINEPDETNNTAVIGPLP